MQKTHTKKNLKGKHMRPSLVWYINPTGIMNLPSFLILKFSANKYTICNTELRHILLTIHQHYI